MEAKPISLFTGTEVLRNSYSIKFLAFSPNIRVPLPSPFISALGNLTGFKTVSVELDLGDKKFDLLMEIFLDALEPSLGPGVISQISEGGGLDPLWELTFYPRDHISKAKVTEPSSSTQKDEGEKSLS